MPIKTKAIRAKPALKMGHLLPSKHLTNPFKGGTKFAKAGVTTMSKGAGIYLKMHF